MNRTDVTGILALLQTEYPASFVRLTPQQMQAKANLWCEMLESDNGRLVLSAVKAIISTEVREFAPSIGEIRAKMQELTAPQELSETEAWALVSKACSNGIYGYKGEFDKLPTEVQAAVGAPEQLREWAQLDSDTLQSVVASNFMRAYKVTTKRKREAAMLPASVRELIDGLSERMRLGNGT